MKTNITEKDGMKIATVWSNDFWEPEKREVERLLREGCLVSVGADCIGHTRAAIIKSNAEAYFEEIGAAKEYLTDEWGKTIKWKMQ